MNFGPGDLIVFDFVRQVVVLRDRDGVERPVPPEGITLGPAT